jgi:hypothetical protein
MGVRYPNFEATEEILTRIQTNHNHFLWNTRNGRGNDNNKRRGRIMPDNYLIALDMDWAADSVISRTAELLRNKGVKATWFATHISPSIKQIYESSGLFEIGIHPNFSEDSTQGNSPREILSNLKRIFPTATSARTHRLVQSSPLLKIMCDEFDIQHDLSLLLPNTQNIIPHELHLGGERPLIRVPTFWEDDLELITPKHTFDFSQNRFHLPGLKIFVFHPIHVVLNSSTMESYERCKKKIRLQDCSLNELEEFINHDAKGIGTFFKEIIDFVSKDKSVNSMTVTELVASWKMSDNHR